MGTRSSFFSLADTAAAREFGRRHYGVFVGLRLLRVVWPILAGLLVVGGAVAFLLWSPDLPTVEIRIPSVPVWVWYVLGGVSGLVLLRILFRSSNRIRMFLFRIGL